jgi:hypothetical protein
MDSSGLCNPRQQRFVLQRPSQKEIDQYCCSVTSYTFEPCLGHEYLVEESGNHLNPASSMPV